MAVGTRGFEKDVVVATSSKGDYIVHIEVDERTDRKKTVDLESADGYRTVSMSGSFPGGGGQCIDRMVESVDRGDAEAVIPRETLGRLEAIWRDWHLNDMRAGTRPQNEAIETAGYEEKPYAEKRELLREQDLLVDRGYEYGTAWLVEPAPEDVIEFLSVMRNPHEVQENRAKLDEAEPFAFEIDGRDVQVSSRCVGAREAPWRDLSGYMTVEFELSVSVDGGPAANVPWFASHEDWRRGKSALTRKDMLGALYDAVRDAKAGFLDLEEFRDEYAYDPPLDEDEPDPGADAHRECAALAEKFEEAGIDEALLDKIDDELMDRDHNAFSGFPVKEAPTAPSPAA